MKSPRPPQYEAGCIFWTIGAIAGTVVWFMVQALH